METYIYLHHDKHLCAIVTSEEGNKFVDHIERFCTKWEFLIDEAKSGFNGFPLYEESVNYGIGFWDKYLEIFECYDKNYELLLAASDGEIIIDSEKLENKGEYFEPLLKIMRLGEAYNFNSVCDVVYSQDYIILSSDRQLLICTNIKVPFEPNDEQKKLRELIRNRLMVMHSFDNQVLYAEYGSSESQLNDIENVLFYNIGTSSFNNVLTNETPVYFQRMQPNEIYATENVTFKYIYHYSWHPKGKYEQWWENNPVCEWNKVSLEKVNSTAKVFDYYNAIKNNQRLIKCLGDGSETTLGLKIQLSIPKKAIFLNVLNVIKPMIDGTICAFHTPCNIMADEVCKRISINKELLLSKENTCLGKCCYVIPYRDSVKWNPQDDRLDCAFIEPVIVDEDTFSFSGKIYAIPNYM